ncbi:uncharacterized protein LAESUDRAFT_810035 [Laetiporus sulphureus 93-53]|uniref:Uncharacterized protein n=1 Tax=Laetiporus sulphureus 93-53 TaxID=1314785 RepID=A0A165GI19_9APHY|nr:uncharacterized protein LAESUDRAFT_810035 [Laetiporus sulphureus 93-53]KZT10377.1 hypothetical protein LAESUDRAFT_810035 [Laetiporus sulphureus 93-53]
MALFPPPSPCAGLLRSPTSDFFRQQERDYFARKGKEIVPMPHDDVGVGVDVHDRAVPRSEPDEVNPSALIVHRWSPNQELRQARFTRDAGLNKYDARIAFAGSSKSSTPHQPPHPVNTATRASGPPDVTDTKHSALKRRDRGPLDQAALTYKKIIILEEPPREPAKEVSASSVYEELRRRQRRRRQRRGQCVPLSGQIAVIS